MKKITIAAMAAMVLASGAMAADTVEDTPKGKGFSIMDMAQYLFLAQELPSFQLMSTSYTTVGVGFANTQNVGSSAIVLNYQQLDPYTALGLNLDTSKHYFGAGVKARVTPAINYSYVGVGYIDADGRYDEKGGYGIIGLQESFNFDGVMITGDVGYRFGAIDGPAGYLGVSKRFGPEFDSHVIGLRVGLEQLKNSDENINRLAIYGTLTF